ncbi:hypothetical protein QPK87_20485 [Kamptonema cortianum]|nr:hypothetical protein [Kamptonema cortianum]
MRTPRSAPGKRRVCPGIQQKLSQLRLKMCGSFYRKRSRASNTARTDGAGSGSMRGVRSLRHKFWQRLSLLPASLSSTAKVESSPTPR